MTQATGHRQTKRIQRGSAASRPPLVDASSVTGPEPQRVHEPSPAVRAGCRTRGCDGGSGCRIFCLSISRCLFKPWFKNRYLPGLPKACCAGSWQVQASGCRLCVPRRPTETTISGVWSGRHRRLGRPRPGLTEPKNERWMSISVFPMAVEPGVDFLSLLLTSWGQDIDHSQPPCNREYRRVNQDGQRGTLCSQYR